MEYNKWNQAHFTSLSFLFEPTRAAAIFILSILMGLFLRMPVTGDRKKDAIISGITLGALTIVQVILFFTIRTNFTFLFVYHLFTMWMPMMGVCAGVAIASLILRKQINKE